MSRIKSRPETPCPKTVKNGSVKPITHVSEKTGYVEPGVPQPLTQSADEVATEPGDEEQP